MMRAFVFASALLQAMTAHGDEIDRATYHDVPAKWQAITATAPVNRDDPVSDETRERFAGQRPYGEYMVYYAADGAIDAVDVVKSIPGCDDFVVAWIRDHEKGYRPPAHERMRRLARIEVSFPRLDGSVVAPDKPKPVPAPPGTKPKNVPPHMFDTQLLAHELPHLPDAVKLKARGDLVGVYKICAGVDGKITQVTPMQSIAGADEAIMATLRSWQIKPQALPICTMTRFVFTVERGRRFQ